MPLDDLVAEARRTMEVCNACRYCEGFCAVFPAMELRREFSDGDLTYLANLCHGCRGCYYACQYAPPHEFGLNVPKVFAELRAASYGEYAWPRPFARLFERNGVVVSLATVAGIVLVVMLAAAFQPVEVMTGVHAGPGAFYRVIPWGLMAGVAGAATLFALLALVIGLVRFWRDTGGGPAAAPSPAARAAGDVLTLRNLGGGGHGCNDRDGSFSTARRRFHHALFYGFLLCFASTSVATVYDHFLGWVAPYPFWSLPVLLGTAGGIGIVVGTGGMAWLKIAGDPAPVSRRLLGGDYAFVFLLFLVAATGLVLLVLRETPAMATLLAVHLGAVIAFFLLLPYSKFVHGGYRAAALLRSRIEERRHGTATAGS
jgi:citrate/tricarballylate utilization protein